MFFSPFIHLYWYRLLDSYFAQCCTIISILIVPESASGSPFVFKPCPFDVVTLFFSISHTKNVPGSLCNFPDPLLESAISLRTLVPFSEGRYLETKMQELAMSLFTVFLLLLCHLQWTELRNVCVYFCMCTFVYLLLSINIRNHKFMLATMQHHSIYSNFPYL